MKKKTDEFQMSSELEEKFKDLHDLGKDLEDLQKRYNRVLWILGYVEGEPFDKKLRDKE